ncbi:MAG: response regulator [Desulfobacterota bacterium]|nr:response regulator [Thermodesulfobacteriota bacterium]
MSSAPKILIVDDEPTNVKLVTAQLSPAGYETQGVYSGEEALELIPRWTPDLVLLDIMMPGIDGYEVVRRLKKDDRYRDIPVILITALDGLSDKVTGLEAGADEFLNKPVNAAELMARVKSLIRLKQTQDQLKQQKALPEVEGFWDRPGGGTESPLGLPTVLLVEDDEKDARLIQGYLLGEPYVVKRITGGEEAISRARQEKIDVVLLDILLPDLDGLKVCQQLKAREETRNIQVLLMTALQELEVKVKGIDLGADDYLVKPVNIHELRVRLKSLIRKKAYLDNLQANYSRALQSAITDRLTGLYNQAFFHYSLEKEVRRSAREQMALAVIMIDVDHFKEYNDTRGHLAGDELLKHLGALIRENIRDIDLAARYGGDEFAVILSHTDPDKTDLVAERIRQALARPSSPVATNGITLSLGVAVFPRDAADPQQLLHCADQALYQAKREGKNRIGTYGQSPPEE